MPCVAFLYAKRHSEMNATSALVAARDLVQPPMPQYCVASPAPTVQLEEHTIK